MFSGSSGSPDFRFGMTSADFHVCAKQFDANEEFMRLVMAGKVAGRLSLSTLADTLSCPGARRVASIIKKRGEKCRKVICTGDPITLKALHAQGSRLGLALIITNLFSGD